jgi:hypothetical protein
MNTYMSLEDYAEHIRRKMHRLMTLTGTALGSDHPAFVMAAELCTEAAGIVNGTQMEQERAGLEALDLATLPAPKD